MRERLNILRDFPSLIFSINPPSPNPRPGFDLLASEVHLYLMTLDGANSATSEDWGILDPAEHQHAQRFRRPSDRALYVRAHAGLRCVLSRYAPIPPQTWRFVRLPHGKPTLCPTHHPTLQPLKFNLSHCAGRVAIAVAWEREVGVDIEALAALHDPHLLAPSVLSPVEHTACKSLQKNDDPGYQDFLLTRWTLKEAALKAMGLGLGQIDLRDLDMATSEPVSRPLSPWRARVSGKASPTHQDWLTHAWFDTQADGPAHRWALACTRHAWDEPLHMRLIHFSDLSQL